MSVPALRAFVESVPAPEVVRAVQVQELAYQEEPMSDWQPIETAPKGVELLLYEPDVPDDCPLFLLGSYVDFGDAVPEGYHSGWFDTMTGRYEIHPSHWMPLPEPPK